MVFYTVQKFCRCISKVITKRLLPFFWKRCFPNFQIFCFVVKSFPKQMIRIICSHFFLSKIQHFGLQQLKVWFFVTFFTGCRCVLTIKSQVLPQRITQKLSFDDLFQLFELLFPIPVSILNIPLIVLSLFSCQSNFVSKPLLLSIYLGTEP